MFNSGVRTCDLTIAFYGRPTLCSPELSFMSNCFSPLNSSVPDSKIAQLRRSGCVNPNN